MENASKALLIAGAILLAILIAEVKPAYPKKRMMNN